MRSHSKVLVAGFSAALLMLVAVSTASAGRLSVSNSRFRITWSPLRFDPGDLRCNVTLEGSFHSATAQKTVGGLVGHVTKAIIAPPAQCANGEATIVQESLPWHVRYRGFTGRLPRMTGVVVGLVGARLRAHINTLGATCEITGTVENPGIGIVLTNEEGTITGDRVDESSSIPLLGFCAIFGTEGAYTGTGAVTLLNAATRITVRLI